MIEILLCAHAKGNDFTEIWHFCFGRFKSDSGASMSVKGLIMIIIIMYSFMCYFSKLEHIDKNENQNNDTVDVSVEKKPHYKGITDYKVEHTHTRSRTKTMTLMSKLRRSQITREELDSSDVSFFLSIIVKWTGRRRTPLLTIEFR